MSSSNRRRQQREDRIIEQEEEEEELTENYHNVVTSPEETETNDILILCDLVEEYKQRVAALQQDVAYLQERSERLEEDNNVLVAACQDKDEQANALSVRLAKLQEQFDEKCEEIEDLNEDLRAANLGRDGSSKSSSAMQTTPNYNNNNNSNSNPTAVIENKLQKEIDRLLDKIDDQAATIDEYEDQINRYAT